MKEDREQVSETESERDASKLWSKSNQNCQFTINLWQINAIYFSMHSIWIALFFCIEKEKNEKSISSGNKVVVVVVVVAMAAAFRFANARIRHTHMQFNIERILILT